MAAGVALQVIVSPFLETVFDNLASLIRSEFSLVSGVKKDLEKLSRTLSTIRSVIQDAEDKQINNNLILDWLRNLKDAAYDAEDVIDECATEANLAPEAGSETIHEVHNKSLLSCFGFKQIIFRRAIGKRIIKNLIERFDEIASERLKFHLNLRETSSIPIEPQVYGRDDEKENIVELLVSYSTDEGDAPQEGVVALYVCPVLGSEIVIKCAGIPLAAKAVGGLLRFKREVKEWLFVRDRKIWDLPQDKEDAILPTLMLSYNHLPPDLKQCFAYRSIFPQNYFFLRRRVIALLHWLAQIHHNLNTHKRVMKAPTIAEIQDCSKLESLPDGLQNVAGTLHSLRITSWSGLTSLPEWIGSFTVLRNLELSDCENLKCLPESLKHLTSLKTLAISSNYHPDPICIVERERRRLAQDFPHSGP